MWPFIERNHDTKLIESLSLTVDDQSEQIINLYQLNCS
jgi:hypothetical protein